MPKAETPEILEEALAMEPAKRLHLATLLLDSVEEPEREDWAEAWASEIDERIARVEAGRDRGESWDEVRAQALSKLGR